MASRGEKEGQEKGQDRWNRPIADEAHFQVEKNESRCHERNQTGAVLKTTVARQDGAGQARDKKINGRTNKGGRKEDQKSKKDRGNYSSEQASQWGRRFSSEQERKKGKEPALECY